jgi:hypothetical protein
MASSEQSRPRIRRTVRRLRKRERQPSDAGSGLMRALAAAGIRCAHVAARVLLSCAVLAGTGLLASGSLSGQQAVAAPSARPAGALPPANWIIKSNDLQELEAAGNPGVFQYVGCGRPSDPLPCYSGQVQIFTNFFTFQKAVAAGLSGTVIIDYETWSFTPRAQAARPDYWIERTQQLVAKAHSNGQDIITIEAPGGRRKAWQLVREDVTAARAGSPIVEIQSQFGVAAPEKVFRPFVARAIRAIRAVSKKVTILVGLATDAGGTPVTAGDMVRAYHIAVRLHAQGFWLNAAIWPPPRGKGCAPHGCPLIALKFLQDIDAVGH